jgi:colanic acid/amylovoran biosynthesis glycosyltransferase
VKVLHLFDLYLPSTLSWVSQLLGAMPEIGVQVGAPWIVRGQFYNPAFQYHVFPPQRMLFPAPATEFEHPRWQRLFTASQRFVPSYPYWLRQKLKADPPDLLHAHFGPTGCLYLPLAIALQRPLVVTFYGFDYSKLPNLRPVFREKYKALFAGAARVLAASETGCEKLRSMGCPSEKLAVVKPSPNLNAFPFRYRAKPAGQLRLVQVATFTPKKGHLVALEAFRLASMDCPNLHLTLAGELQDKALVAQLRRYIAIHGLESRVNWLEFVRHSDMAAFLDGFDAFLHPSCHAPDGDHEATPVVLLEAQACGLPVLASTHFDLPAEVLHGQTGLLAPEGDAVVLAEHIRHFYQMENIDYQQYSLAARRHVEQHFDVKNSAQTLLNIYQHTTTTYH